MPTPGNKNRGFGKSYKEFSQEGMLSEEELKKGLEGLLRGNPEEMATPVMEGWARNGIDPKSLLLAARLCGIAADSAPIWSSYHTGAVACEKLMVYCSEKLAEYLDQFGRP